MITLEKLKIFARYKGDGDAFSRSARQTERELLNDNEWYLIDTLIQDATVINRQLGSEHRTNEATLRLMENSENPDVIEEIKRLAEIDPRRWA